MNSKTMIYGLILLLCGGMTACVQKEINLSENEFIKLVSDIMDNNESEQVDVERIFSLIEKNPQIMDFNFLSPSGETRLPEGIYETTGYGENRIRVYNIEKHGGKINPNDTEYVHFVQYRKDGVITLKKMPDYSDSGIVVNEIYSLASFFLVKYHQTHPLQGLYQEFARIYSIGIEGNFISKKVFKVKHENLDEIEFLWDEAWIVNGSDRKHYGITYDDKRERLFIPLAIENDGRYIPTNKDIVYQWKNNNFEYIGINGNFELHPSIKDFEYEVTIFKTEKFYVRIDMMENGRYRYASWSKGRNMIEKPDLVLFDGTKRCWGEPEVGWCDCDETYDNGESLVRGERYIFTSGKYSYIYNNGWWKGRIINELSILRNNEEILCEEISFIH